MNLKGGEGACRSVDEWCRYWLSALSARARVESAGRFGPQHPSHRSPDKYAVMLAAVNAAAEVLPSLYCDYAVGGRYVKN